MQIINNIGPVYNEDSKILILGTIPSPKSRSAGFFYSHPQNRFWKVISIILKSKMPSTIDEKKEMVLKHNIALWDVLAQCEIEGADDSSIKNPVPNDFNDILANTQITKIFTTGQKATLLFNKLCSEYSYTAEYLPSTSPANCRLSEDKLVSEYKKILDHLKTI